MQVTAMAQITVSGDSPGGADSDEGTDLNDH